MSDFSIFLRPFKENDHLLINKWRNDPEIQKMTGGPIRYVSLEIEREWVLSRMKDNIRNIYWAICLNNESEKMVGYISLNNIDHLNKCADAGGTVIGDNVMLGAGSKILPGVTIGNNVKVGANCVVVEDIPDNATVVLPKPRIILR